MRALRPMIAIGCVVLLPSCELQKITTATATDVIIAEVVLRAGDSIQSAYLHRTITENQGARVPGALVTVREGNSGAQIRLTVAPDSMCVDDRPKDAVASIGTCYIARVPVTTIKPGLRYTLRIETPAGEVMTGASDVPAAFEIVRPAARSGAGVTTACRLEPNTTIDLTWTRSAGASVYLTDARLRNLRQALRAAGFDIEGNDAVGFEGLSISSADTTLRFPAEIGVFERFNNDKLPVLLAIHEGLPLDVDVTILVAAADRNYVNWVRGGNFNPSGSVHIASIYGDGTGLFGTLVPRRILISTKASTRTPCE